ncbi:hypothetical protein [Streptomyces antibioticus]|uniref:hypothetical protein n=1 Tax=Streptomyces antibioticus TaxID=1890 RepID=UPI0033AB4816
MVSAGLGTRDRMHGNQTYATSDTHGWPGHRADVSPRRPTGRSGGRHRRHGGRGGRWHRRLLAYRGVELLPSSSPDGPGEECLLLVHIRKVVGRVTYHACDRCAEGVITDVVLEEPFLGCGLGTRALSHLRARYPEVTWRTTLDTRLTRDLMHRLRIPRLSGAESERHCCRNL